MRILLSITLAAIALATSGALPIIRCGLGAPTKLVNIIQGAK